MTMGMDAEKGSPDPSSGQGSSPRCCLSPATALPQVPPTADHRSRHRVFCSNSGASTELAKVVGDLLCSPGSWGPKGSPEGRPHTEGAPRQPPGEPAHRQPVRGLSVAQPAAHTLHGRGRLLARRVRGRRPLRQARRPQGQFRDLGGFPFRSDSYRRLLLLLLLSSFLF